MPTLPQMTECPIHFSYLLKDDSIPFHIESMSSENIHSSINEFMGSFHIIAIPYNCAMNFLVWSFE